MNKYTLLKITIIFASILTFFQCQKNPIPYNLDNSEVFIDTLTITALSGGTYFSPPLMGSTSGLYFGKEDGNENLFSLLRFRNLSYSNSIYTYNLLDEDVSMDSIVFTFSALDSNLLIDHPELMITNFELFYFPSSGDSVFDEDESNYLNISEADVSNSISIGQGHFIEPDQDEETSYPYISINVDDLENVLNFISDTTDSKNRTFMLKNVDPLDYLIAIRSRETTNYPLMTAHYKVDGDTLRSIYYPIEDITIVKPRAVTNEDKTNLSIGRASGLKSILQIDLSSIPMDSATIVFKTAELYINSTSVDSLDDWNIIATILDTSITISDYWEIDEDEYTIYEGETMTGYFDNTLLGIQIRDLLQGYMTGSFKNNGLKLYASALSDPFKTVHLLINQDDKSLNPYIKIAYVKL